MATPSLAADTDRFSDIEDAAIAEAASYLCDSGIIYGTGDGKFSPNNNLSYAELAVILGRIVPLKYLPGETWYDGQMQACITDGYIMGAPDQLVSKKAFVAALAKARPRADVMDDASDAPISRGEMVVLLKSTLAAPTVFGEEEMQQALGGVQDRIATVDDVIEIIYGQESVKSDPCVQGSEDVATVGIFLDVLSEAFDGVYYYQEDGDYIYPGGDTMWMSSEEWSSLTADPGRSLTLGTAKVIVQRTVDCAKFIRERRTVPTYEKYRDVIEGFFPEFLPLVENNEEAVGYWLDPNPNASFRIYNSSDFANVIHELLHEESARRSGAYKSRKAGSNAWTVTWSKNPAVTHYYDISRHQWLELDTSAKLPQGNIIKDSVPPAVKDVSLYKTYILSSQAASNSFGLYGMLQEFCSTVAETRVHTISSSMNFNFEDFPDSHLTEHYFWKGAILNYLATLSEEKPSTYSMLLSDNSLVTLIVDLLDYADAQIELAGTAESLSEETVVMKEWSSCSAALEQDTVLHSIANF